MNLALGEGIDADSMTKAEIVLRDEIALSPSMEEKFGSTAQFGAIPERVISKRAYELWLDRGCPEGSPEVDWYKAESELNDAGSQESASVRHATADAAAVAARDPGD